MEHPVFTLEESAMERWRNGDPSGFLELAADQIVYVDPRKPVVLFRDSVIKSWKRVLALATERRAALALA